MDEVIKQQVETEGYGYIFPVYYVKERKGVHCERCGGLAVKIFTKTVPYWRHTFSEDELKCGRFAQVTRK